MEKQETVFIGFWNFPADFVEKKEREKQESAKLKKAVDESNQPL